MEDLLKNILIFIIGPLITLLFGWVLGNRKSIAEVRILELDATTKAIQIWRDMASAMQEELKDLHAERLREVTELKEEIVKLQKIVAELQKENKQLKAHIDTVVKNNI